MNKMTEDNCRIGYPKSQTWILKVLHISVFSLFLLSMQGINFEFPKFTQVLVTGETYMNTPFFQDRLIPDTNT